jgi:hypothetical protein
MGKKCEIINIFNMLLPPCRSRVRCSLPTAPCGTVCERLGWGESIPMRARGNAAWDTRVPMRAPPASTAAYGLRAPSGPPLHIIYYRLQSGKVNVRANFWLVGFCAWRQCLLNPNLPHHECPSLWLQPCGDRGGGRIIRMCSAWKGWKRGEMRFSTMKFVEDQRFDRTPELG